MNALSLHGFHLSLGAHFAEVAGQEVPDHYGEPAKDHAALSETAGVLDLSFRGRLCLTGADRQRFLHGQVTNDVSGLKPGAGCYAALVTAKGKMVSDLNIYPLADEILLDFEPGLTGKIAQRLEKYVIADDVEIVDVAPHFGLLSVQGPKAAEVLRRLQLEIELPGKPLTYCKGQDAALGELYIVNLPRVGTAGFDLFAPVDSMAAVAEQLAAAAQAVAGRMCGWRALEIARIEAGIPRFGADMDDSNLPPEAGLETRAISYTKGCYIGQEVIARIRTYGHVNKMLRGLRIVDELQSLPARGDKLFLGGKEVGSITSAADSPRFKTMIALGIVRREAAQSGTELVLKTAATEANAVVVDLPFH